MLGTLRSVAFKATGEFYPYCHSSFYHPMTAETLTETEEQERQELITTLCRLDPNGDYKDTDCDEPIMLHEARYLALVKFSIMIKPLVWCYVPNDQGDGWDAPYVCEDECPSLADAHRHAAILRQHYPGHLFAVTGGRQPLLTR